MKRTSALVLVIAAAVGAIIGFLLDQVLTASSRPTFTPSYTLPALLVVIAVVVILLALPIRRAQRSANAARVDPFRAVRTVVLARASSILGSAVGGFALGLLGFILTRPASPPVGSVVVTAVTVGASVVLVVCALLAESFCSLPKDDDDDSPGTDGPPAPVAH